MKENIDLALRLFCYKTDNLRPVQLNPFTCEELACATNGYILLAVKGHATYDYYKDDGEYGSMRVPNIKSVLPTTYCYCGKMTVADIDEAVTTNDYYCTIKNIHISSTYMKMVTEASKLLGVSAWNVDIEHKNLVLTADNENVIILVLSGVVKGEEIKILPKDANIPTNINEDFARASLVVFKRKEKERIEEEQRKKEEYDRSHHKIWKIYVKRTDVGVLLVEAPDEETAFAIAEQEASEATFDDDYEYEVDKDDFEEDVDHYKIQRDYSCDSIATPEKTKYGYKFIRVNEYEHFDEEE